MNLSPMAFPMSPSAKKSCAPQREHGVYVKASYSCGASRFCVSQGSVVEFTGDAIVNAANRGGLGGGGVDGAINSVGGRELQEARRKLPVLNEFGDRIPTGEARATVAGNLPAEWVIHAVGPIYWEAEGGDYAKSDALLGQAYANSLKVAAEKGVKVLGCCLLSAGIFRGDRPLCDVLEIACRAVKEHVYEGLQEVHLIAFTVEEEDELLAAAQRAFKRSSTPCSSRCHSPCSSM
ncbi:unnamed protein product [Effrenium voratum]|nr:unnamed protein product [Effrenium voratum]